MIIIKKPIRKPLQACCCGSCAGSGWSGGVDASRENL